ncbi:F-box/FBD/LRR-repeat protein At1g13570-like [Tasmannia lanceolata]|uniref:F-box/FBD/LRR-repeat protein At1g13570-like n=1 Tax=Tasmannia lanceolata TaxID=3420 RepID=UPI0040642B6B
MVPITYEYLKNLSLSINIMNLKEILAAICLCKASPKLQELTISVYSDAEAASEPVENLWEANFWEAQEQLDCVFNYLKIVKMTKISGTIIDLGIIEFILASAPVLETLYFKISEDMVSEKSRILEELIRFRRASPQAKIIYLDNSGNSGKK